MRLLRALKREDGSSRYVFMTERGAPMTPAGFRKMLSRLADHGHGVEVEGVDGFEDAACYSREEGTIRAARAGGVSLGTRAWDAVAACTGSTTRTCRQAGRSGT